MPPYSEQQKLEVLSELGKLALSETFVSSPSSQRLLQFLISQELAGESASLKESYIGHVHYGRKPGYDTKRDALVRVNVKRLRSLLETHYAENNTSALRIEVPKGSYVPHFIFQPADSASREVLTDESSDRIAAPDAALLPQDSTPSVEYDSLRGRSALEHIAGRKSYLLFAVFGLLSVLMTITIALIAHHRAVSPVTASLWTAHPLFHLGGVAEFADWSPSGDAIAFAWTPDAPQGGVSKIGLRNLRTGETSWVDTGEYTSSRPAWSPDGLQVAYLVSVGNSNEIRIFSLRERMQRTVATLSGSYPWLCQLPRIAWTKDGQHILTADQSASRNGCRIFSIDVLTGARQQLTEPAPGVIADVEPAVSHDGKHIAFLRNTGTLVGDVYSMNLDGTDLHRVTWDQRDIMGFCWDSDNHDFILASRRNDGILRLWQTRQNGHYIRLTDGLTAAGFPAMSPDGNRIVFSSYHNVSSLWRAWTHEGRAQPVIENGSVNADPAFSPDGRKIAFRSDASGSAEIWTADADGKNAHQISALNGPFIDHITWSPDGKALAFDCRDSGHTSVCLMPAQGGAILHPVSWDSDEEMPVFSADGRALLFTSERSGAPEIYRVSLDRTNAEISPLGSGVRAAVVPALSILLSARAQPPNGLYAQKINASAELEGPRREVFTFSLGKGELRDAWEPAPEGLWFFKDPSEKGDSTIFSFSIRNQAVSPVITFGHPLVKGDKVFAVAPDGKSALLVEQGVQTADLSVLRRTDQH